MENTFKGRILEGKYIGKQYKEGTVFEYQVYIPTCQPENDGYALLINHDGLNYSEVEAMEQLFETGDAPLCVIVGITGGTLCATIENARDRVMRMNSYDWFTSEYPNFLVEEFLPYIKEKYNLRISTSPDLHAVSGGSSGGISAWNIAWCRMDCFKRVYMSSPSFLAMGKGNEIPVLIRKCETKPIRVYMEYSENEPDDYFGSSFCAAMEAERALQFAGYEMLCKYYPGEGHCSRYHNVDTLREAFKWLWADFKTKPVEVKKLSPRVESVVCLDEPWVETNYEFPSSITAYSNGLFTAKGKYIAQGGEIIFQDEKGIQTVVAIGFGKITSLAVSSDKWRLYIGDETKGCLYAMTIKKDGALDQKYVHATLHLSTNFEYCGIFDLCVDSTDRIYVATEIGVQAVRSCGLIDVILSLPHNGIPKKVEVNDGYLYVRTEEKIYKRKLVNTTHTNEMLISIPLNNGYYD